jgi:hypothetical protein
MTTYKEIVIERLDKTVIVIERTNEDGSVSYIPSDPANSDYQEYLNPSEAKAK